MKSLKHSRQRESILESLRNRTDHPTADMLYLDVRKEYPNISLGTVYRNLSLLVDLGEIQKIICGDGLDRFDYTTNNHYHFMCDCCNNVYDVPVEVTTEMEDAVSKATGGLIKRHSAVFYGTCEKCLEKGTGN